MSSKNKNHLVGYIITTFMLLALLNNAWFFLFIAKLGFGKWLIFNACSLSIIIYLVCFVFYKIKRKEVYLAIALLPLYYYGTMGLFLLPWDSVNMFAQITHVVITLCVIWILFICLKELKFESIGKGLLISILVFVPVFAIIQNYSGLFNVEIIQILQNLH